MSDGTGTITIYGLIGDQCLDDQDCFMDFTSCIGGVCTCQSGFDLDRTNMSCEAIQKSFCDPNPCKGTGTYNLGIKKIIEDWLKYFWRSIFFTKSILINDALLKF